MIRRVEAGDRERILKLLKENFPEESYPFLVFELEEAIRGAVEGYVYEKGGIVLGYIVLRFFGGAYNIDTLVVDKDVRGKGYGSTLVSFAKEQCKSQNVRQVNVCTFFEDKIGFYKKQGFKEMGSLEGPFAPFEKKRTYLKWINEEFNSGMK